MSTLCRKHFGSPCCLAWAHVSAPPLPSSTVSPALPSPLSPLPWAGAGAATELGGAAGSPGSLAGSVHHTRIQVTLMWR